MLGFCGVCCVGGGGGIDFYQNLIENLFLFIQIFILTPGRHTSRTHTLAFIHTGLSLQVSHNQTDRSARRPHTQLASEKSHHHTAEPASRLRRIIMLDPNWKENAPAAEPLPKGLELTVSGYNMGMLRVQGDDGDVNQILRWAIKDKQQQWHDVFRVMEEGKPDAWSVRPYDEGEEHITDLKVGWEEALKKAV